MGESKRKGQAEVPEPLPYDRALLLCEQAAALLAIAEKERHRSFFVYRMAKKELERSRAITAPELIKRVDAEFRERMTATAQEQESAVEAP